MDKHFNFKEWEEKIIKLWEDEKLFDFKGDSEKIYSIDLPPLYVSGESPHMGHFLNLTYIDIVARYKRLCGYEVFLPMGLDNNGHPTEIYVEKEKGISKASVSKEEYIKICRETSLELEKLYLEIFRKIGLSFCRNIYYTTIDPEAIRVAQTSFIELYEKNVIYRDKLPCFYCPKCKTGLSQADLEDMEKDGKLFYIKFKVKDTGEDLIIATTRPELLCAVVAIFVNPNDERYKSLIGKTVIVPVYGQEVPVMADDKVDKDFGTGAVMVATFGDKTDIQWVYEKGLPIKEAIGLDGTMTELAGPLKGLGIEEAKKKIVEILEEQGLIVKTEPLKQNVPICWRCKTPIEIVLLEQWLVKIKDQKDIWLEQGKKIKWIPEYHFKKYEDWVKNLVFDWNISRQRYYGVPFPVWYGKKKDGSVVVILPRYEDLPVDPRFQDPPKKVVPEDVVEIVPEDDVMDTWFTSSLTPMLASGDWRKSEERFRKVFPYDLRSQGIDIIRTWAFYTIVKAYYHESEIPWKNILNNGYVAGPDKRKMSKSLGNVVLPKDVLPKYGVDACRYWCICGKVGENTYIKYQDFERGKALRDKLWNIFRFFLMNTNEIKKPDSVEPNAYIDRLFLNKFHKTLTEVLKAYEDFEFMTVQRTIDDLVFNVLSSYYIELVKKRLMAQDHGLYTVLYYALRELLKILHPVMPMVTEALWQEVYRTPESEVSIVRTRFLDYDYDESKVEEWDIVTMAIDLMRKAKTEKGLKLGQEVNKIIFYGPEVLKKVEEELKTISRAKEIEIKDSEEIKVELLD